jgi:hypothetical protein
MQSGSDKAAAAEPANECSLPVAPTKDGNDVSHDSACMIVFQFLYIWDQFNMSRPRCIFLSVVT